MSLLLQQLADRLEARLLFQQPVVSDALIKQQRGRIDHVGRLQARKLIERFVVQFFLAQPAAIPQPQIVAHQRRRFVVGQQREIRAASLISCGLAQRFEQIAGTGLDFGNRLDRALQQIARRPVRPATRATGL